MPIQPCRFHLSAMHLFKLSLSVSVTPASIALATDSMELLPTPAVLHDLFNLRQAGGHFREIDLPMGDEVRPFFRNEVFWMAKVDRPSPADSPEMIHIPGRAERMVTMGFEVSPQLLRQLERAKRLQAELLWLMGPMDPSSQQPAVTIKLDPFRNVDLLDHRENR